MAYKIAVIPGDGTGPEVVNEGLKVLKAVAEKEKFQMDFHFYDLGENGTSKPERLFLKASWQNLRKFKPYSWGLLGIPRLNPVSWNRASFCACALSWISISTSGP